MDNITIYEIYDPSNGKYYSTFNENNYGTASELKVLSFEKFIIRDEDDFNHLKSKWFEYYPDGDTYDEWSYHEPKYLTIIEGFEKQYEYEKDEIESEPKKIISVIERFYSFEDFNIGYFLNLPYTLYFVKIFERV